jgi:DNA-binding response OmpR family regulator
MAPSLARGGFTWPGGAGIQWAAGSNRAGSEVHRVSDKQRILIVDDQPDILEMTELILVGAGYEISTASSGIEALDHLVLRHCDLVLLDINMPEMDGWETLRLIRADDGMANLPVVMFSVKSELRDKVFGMQEGAVDYITKPFEVDQLLYRVRRIFDSGRGRSRRTPALHPVN